MWSELGGLGLKRAGRDVEGGYTLDWSAWEWYLALNRKSKSYLEWLLFREAAPFNALTRNEMSRLCRAAILLQDTSVLGRHTEAARSCMNRVMQLMNRHNVEDISYVATVTGVYCIPRTPGSTPVQSELSVAVTGLGDTMAFNKLIPHVTAQH